MDLKELGLTQEQAQELVIGRIVKNLMSASHWDDEYDESVDAQSPLHGALTSAAETAANDKVAEMFEAEIKPNIIAFVEGLILQKTNKWGEAKGEAVTFVEYLVARADQYMREPVDYQGKEKGHRDAYNWSSNQTRLTQMVDSHLQYSISVAMKTAMENVNSQIADGIAGTVRIQLAQIVKKLKPKA